MTLDGRVVWDGRRGRGAHAEGDRVVIEGVGGGRHRIRSRPLEAAP